MYRAPAPGASRDLWQAPSDTRRRPPRTGRSLVPVLHHLTSAQEQAARSTMGTRYDRRRRISVDGSNPAAERPNPGTANVWREALPMIQSVAIQNFKSIRDQTIDLDRLTVFVGANGSGKTSVLEAIEFGL